MALRITNPASTKALRRHLRRDATPHESILWGYLRNRRLGKKFRRQHGIGPYIADFWCIEEKLVIELDGGQHYEESAVRHDTDRTAFLQRHGFTILRFSDADINTNIDGVISTILEAFQ